MNKPHMDGDKPYFMQLVQARRRSISDSGAQRGKIAFAIGELANWRFSQIHPQFRIIYIM
ncbi:hypothetical protein [Janthinobacterium sp. SUN120]|uniref:hypothetical protein n=1 Tax=Janthinobacterium sp. SUN120 TaxID=3004099 RepID=UPI0025B146AE|nr:hypothetical protein [Janthinobacterium sp. SUN120]MDN2714113.1 hypothetical protein [Janthinobacterium sp. SUN120]